MGRKFLILHFKLAHSGVVYIFKRERAPKRRGLEENFSSSLLYGSDYQGDDDNCKKKQ